VVCIDRRVEFTLVRVEFTLVPQGAAETAAGDRVLGVKADCLAIFSDRFVELALVAKDRAETAVGE